MVHLDEHFVQMDGAPSQVDEGLVRVDGEMVLVNDLSLSSPQFQRIHCS